MKTRMKIKVRNMLRKAMGRIARVGDEVFMLTCSTPYNGEDPTIIICRTEKKAKGVMENDIREVLTNGCVSADASQLVRESELKAHLSNQASWKIERKKVHG